MNPTYDEVLLILKMNSNWYWFALLLSLILIIDDDFFMTTCKWQWILSDIDNDSNFIVKYHTELNFYIRFFLTWLFITKIDQIFQVKLNFKWFSYCLEVNKFHILPVRVRNRDKMPVLSFLCLYKIDSEFETFVI